MILIGEMRDTETVRAAIAAAETGHLVMSTLHTVDATETVNRVIDFFPPYQQKQVRFALAGTLRGIICQRLVPTVDGGRTPGLEILINNGRVAERIADPEKTHEIKDVIQDGAYYGMATFDQSLLKLVQEGRVTVEDAFARGVQPPRLRAGDAAGRHGAARLHAEASAEIDRRAHRLGERDRLLPAATMVSSRNVYPASCQISTFPVTSSRACSAPVTKVSSCAPVVQNAGAARRRSHRRSGRSRRTVASRRPPTRPRTASTAAPGSLPGISGRPG